MYFSFKLLLLRTRRKGYQILVARWFFGTEPTALTDNWPCLELSVRNNLYFIFFLLLLVPPLIIESLFNAAWHWGEKKAKQHSQPFSNNLNDVQHNIPFFVFVFTGDAGYKPYVTAEPDMVAMTLDGQEDFLIIGCDGLWDTIGVDESAFIVLQYLHHESKWHLSLIYLISFPVYNNTWESPHLPFFLCPFKTPGWRHYLTLPV